ncbi:MAG: DUF6438 domain-containing protein [Bacteroidia bacterium]
MKFILSSVFLLLLAPCNQSKSISNSSKTSDNSKVVIVYQCGACFGRCPEYTLTINGEKKMATFNGIKSTEKIGTYTKTVSDNELSNFVSAFEKAKFNSLEDSYMGTITDFPIKTITYTNNGNTKAMKIRSGAPEVVNSIDKSLKTYAESAEGWKKTDDSNH